MHGAEIISMHAVIEPVEYGKPPVIPYIVLRDGSDVKHFSKLKELKDNDNIVYFATERDMLQAVWRIINSYNARGQPQVIFAGWGMYDLIWPTLVMKAVIGRISMHDCYKASLYSRYHNWQYIIDIFNIAKQGRYLDNNHANYISLSGFMDDYSFPNADLLDSGKLKLMLIEDTNKALSLMRDYTACVLDIIDTYQDVPTTIVTGDSVPDAQWRPMDV